MNNNKIKNFVEYWQNKGDEKSEMPSFWQHIFNISESEKMVEFEKRVKDIKNNTTIFIDCYIPSTKVLIEQKSADIDLKKPISNRR